MSSRHELQKHSERCKVSADKEGYMDTEYLTANIILSRASFVKMSIY